MNYIRTVLLFVGILVIATLIHLGLYGVNFSYEHISDVCFVSSLLFMMPSIIVLSRAYEVTYGIRYTTLALFARDFRDRYPRFIDYRNEKIKPVPSTVFKEIIVAAIVVLIIAIVLARLALQ